MLHGSPSIENGRCLQVFPSPINKYNNQILYLYDKKDAQEKEAERIRKVNFRQKEGKNTRGNECN